MTSLDLVVGVGEIGEGLNRLLRGCGRKVSGFDIDPERRFGDGGSVELMHVCIPYTSNFVDEVEEYFLEWRPRSIILHSTVKPGTTLRLHNRLPDGNVVYSPVRGVHDRMLSDLKRYTKFFSSYSGVDEGLFRECFLNQCGLRIKRFSNPRALEAAKILVDTSYYGWIIIFGQLVDRFCEEQGLRYDEVWGFAEEIHEFLGNRPKVYLDKRGIGGHCVLQNLDLIEDVLPELREIITKTNRETIQRYSGGGGC